MLEYPPKLAPWNQLLQGKAAATRVFLCWEEAQAQLAHVPLQTFALADYGISYGYTPVLVTTPQILASVS